MSKDNQGEYLQFGGMAVPEGVMMRSPNYYAVACRAPNEEIIVKTEPLEETWIGRQKWLKKPFLRGSLALLDTMALGNRAMNWATGVHLDPRYQPEGAEVEQLTAKQAKRKKLSENLQIALAILVAFAFGFFAFKFVPEFLAEVAKGQVFGAQQLTDYQAGFWTNFFAGIVKIGFFIGYLALIRRLPAIYEVFKYHGAEHKAINTVEAREELNGANCAAQTRLHPRCGTNFAIVVLAIGFLMLLVIPRYPTIMGHKFEALWEVVLLRIGWELVLLPTIAGISYEIIRAAGRAKDQRWVNILLKPGLATQLITTAEPQDKHIEVAIQSLEAVLKAEETGVLTNTEVVDQVDAEAVVPAMEAPEDVLS